MLKQTPSELLSWCSEQDANIKQKMDELLDLINSGKLSKQETLPLLRRCAKVQNGIDEVREELMQIL